MITTIRTDVGNIGGLMGYNTEKRRLMPAFFFAAVGG
jgi:hypothetical protein